MISLINDPMRAMGFTHSGIFHADDVFSTAFLIQYFKFAYGREFPIMRVPNWPLRADIEYKPGAIVYDIGMGKFDPHGELEFRENGVPYAAFGKLWREFGYNFVSKRFPDLPSIDNAWIFQKFDFTFVQGIDAIDNGTMPKADYPAQATSVSTIIANMNPNWDEDDSTVESLCFYNAVEMADEIIDIVLNRLAASARAKSILSEGFSEVANKGTIMTLKQFCPWQEEVINGNYSCAKNILYILYPSKRNPGSWKWQVVPTSVGSFDQRCHVPEGWCGKTGDELYDACGCLGATFVHKNGFLGECTSYESAYSMVCKIIRLAIQRGELAEGYTQIVRTK